MARAPARPSPLEPVAAPRLVTSSDVTSGSTVIRMRSMKMEPAAAKRLTIVAVAWRGHRRKAQAQQKPRQQPDEPAECHRH